MKKTIIITLLGMFLAVSSASAQTAKEDAGLTPKSAFYFLDSFGEWLNLKLTFNKTKKVEKKLKYASERMAEMKALEEEGALEKEHADRIEDDYEALSTDAEKDVDDLKTQGQDVAELVKKMEALAAEHTAKLEAVLENAPEQAREAIERALEVSKRGHERAIEALSKEIEEGDIIEEELSEDARENMKEAKEKRRGEEVKELELEEETEELEEMMEEIDEDDSLNIENELNSL